METDYILLALCFLILYIVILVRWWNMTTNIEQIRKHLIITDKPKLTYLVAIGEKERAQKLAVKMLVDILYPIYFDEYNSSKADSMNSSTQPILTKIQRLGLSIPDYVTSGEKFIDYLNSLTGRKVTYED